MRSNADGLIVVTDGYWRHIRFKQIYHRHYPEVRGEGRSIGEAARHLARQLALGLDRAQGRVREAIERALAEVLALAPAGARTPRRPSAAIG